MHESNNRVSLRRIQFNILNKSIRDISKNIAITINKINSIKSSLNNEPKYSEIISICTKA